MKMYAMSYFILLLNVRIYVICSTFALHFFLSAREKQQ